MANKTIPDLTTIASPSSSALLWINDPSASPQDRGILLKTIDGVRTPSSYNLNAIVVPGTYQWTGQATTNYPTCVGSALTRLDTAVGTILAADAFILRVFYNSANLLVQELVDIDMVDANRRPLPGYKWIRTYDGSTFSSWIAISDCDVVTEISTTAGSLPPVSWNYYVRKTTNPFVINLPSAASYPGIRIKIANRYVSAATGLVRIVPYSGEQIESLGANVAIYLQAYDSSGLACVPEVELVGDATNSKWIASGRYFPYQSVDTQGAGVVLGKLRMLPLNTTTNRQILISPLTASAWVGPYTAAGVLGVPTKAKGVRLKLDLLLLSGAAGYSEYTIAFSDNNTYTPTLTTAHPSARTYFKASAALDGASTSTFIDIPLNSSGAFYVYCITKTNCTPSPTAAVVGFYMGD